MLVYFYSYWGRYEEIAHFLLSWLSILSVVIHPYFYTHTHTHANWNNEMLPSLRANNRNPAFWALLWYIDDWWSKQFHYIYMKPFLRTEAICTTAIQLLSAITSTWTEIFMVRDAQPLNSIICDNRDVIYPHRLLQAFTFSIYGLQITLM